MNEAAATALYEAERKGVRQIRRNIRDMQGGRCAIGVLADALGVEATNATLDAHRNRSCPLCGGAPDSDGLLYPGALLLLAHLNDVHELSFGEIARKLGPDHA